MCRGTAARHGTLLVAVAAVIGLGACLEPSAPELTHCGQIYGHFEGRSNGAAADTVAGCAYYTISTVSGTFGMVLTNGGPLSDMPMVKVFSTSLPNGSRVVGPNAGELYGVIFLGSRTFQLTSGTLAGEAANGNWGRRIIVGTLDLIGTESGGATIRVAGRFTSGCVGQQEATKPGIDPERQVPPVCAVSGMALR